ncbi:MAG: hypothetical protein H7X91_11785 [Burkholderiales bacterium]|nr:hypothetical protein [Burkholderiales bacterium]
MAREAKPRTSKSSEPRVVTRETTIIRADKRAYWREDEKFPSYVLIETAIRMWLTATYVLRTEIDQQHLADDIREQNSELIRRAVSIYADMIEKGQLEIYDGVLPLPVRGEGRTNTLMMLRDPDPLSRIHTLDGYYFNGRKLYEAVAGIIPWGNPAREEEDDDGPWDQVPAIWWELIDNYAPATPGVRVAQQDIGQQRESAAMRRGRLLQWVNDEKKKGTRGFLKVVAEKEISRSTDKPISVARLKQILAEPKDAPTENKWQY